MVYNIYIYIFKMAKAIKMVWGYTFFTKPPFTNDLAQNPEHHTATNDFRMVGDPGSCGLDWLNAPKKTWFCLWKCWPWLARRSSTNGWVYVAIHV
jgi:hypothetical protein